MTLASLRDVALLILCVEAFVIGLAPLVGGYLAVRGLGRLLGRVPVWLRTAYGWVLRAQAIVATLMRWLLAPILALSGLKAGLRQGVAAWRRR